MAPQEASCYRHGKEGDGLVWDVSEVRKQYGSVLTLAAVLPSREKHESLNELQWI